MDLIVVVAFLLSTCNKVNGAFSRNFFCWRVGSNVADENDDFLSKYYVPEVKIFEF